jgi:hypothetical protein
LDQRRRERRAGVAGKRQGFLEDLCGIPLHCLNCNVVDQVDRWAERRNVREGASGR